MSIFKTNDGIDDPFGGAKKQEEVKVKPLELNVPDPHDTAKLLGKEDADLEDEENLDKAQAAEKRNKRLVRICCCGSRGCGIGPMTNVEEEDA